MIRARNRTIFFAVVCCFNLMVGPPIHAQIANAVKIHPANEKIPPAKEETQLLPGLVVEKVEKNPTAEDTGLRDGDVLLGWSRANYEGDFDSPSNAWRVNCEQRPRGIVTLRGT
ncbi:MAG TPA: hypothetical protein VGJ30_05590, partial [Candidatus Angelobacter sp.]